MKVIFKILFLVLALLIMTFIILRNPDKSVEELKLKYADAKSEWININGMDVHFKREGSGPPLLLIHGTGASLHTWDGWVDLLGGNFTIYRMDLPAYGLTGPEPHGDYSIDMYTSFIEEFTTNLTLDSFAIAGNSLGGYISWHYAVNHPKKVTSLILIDPAGYPKQGPSTALVFKLASNPLLRPFLKHITPKKFIRKNLEQVYANDDLVTEDLVQRYHDLALRAGNRQAFIDRMQTPGKDLSGQIPNVQCPTLIMWGEQDMWIPPADALKFDADIPNSTLIIYKDLGHVPMEENPKVTASNALQFLKEHN